MPTNRHPTSELRTLLTEYEAELIEAGLKEKTIRTYVDQSERFLRWLDGDYQIPGPR